MALFTNKKSLYYVALILLLALGFRLFVALRLPSDLPDDGRVYAQIARNVLERRVYSHEEQAPFNPSLIRLPGYPLTLAAVYSVAGHYNNTAVRLVQAIIDTATCGLVGLIAFQWTDERRRIKAFYAALTLGAVCPFTSIYVGTILTEVSTSFLAVLLCLIATLAFKSNERRSMLLWLYAGLIAGLAVLFRPDSGLFAAAVGFTLVLFSVKELRVITRIVEQLARPFLYATTFSIAFCLILLPWTIRNHHVFGIFQPLAPAHGEMPGEFVPRGYLSWVRTWLDDGRYVGPVLWRLDTAPISMNVFPAKAFDSDQERQRVVALMDQYNHVASGQEIAASAKGATTTTDQSSGRTSQTGNQNDQVDQDQNDSNDSDADDDSDSDEADDSSAEARSDVEMTPEIDAGFAQIAQERIARSPFRYYIALPVKRATTLWFDTHSQYYPFDGELLPLKDLDYDIHQQYWLPLFAGLTWFYTILGVFGALILWRNPGSRLWLMLVGLIIFLRLGFFSTLENPEPRYTVEIFPFLSVLGGIAVPRLVSKWKTESS